jgi:NDP-sugar pyrophosphorylase family protein
MYQFGLEQSADLTIGTKMVTHQFQYGNVKLSDEDRIVGIDEKPELVFDILSGIYFFKPAVLDEIPTGEYFGMDHLIEKLLSAGKPIARWAIKEYWLDIGQVDDYSKAKEEYSMHFEGQPE